MPKTLLPDINVWLALAFDGHIHHELARAWFEAITDERCFFCRLTQLGVLRLATNPKVFGGDALNLVAAWQLFDRFMSDPRVGYASEPPDLDDAWRRLTHQKTFSPHVWNDAYLAAFAIAAQMEPITFDQALSQYSPVNCTVIK